ncbi:SET domain-containing protein 5 [Apophysomyces sp. BC1034]|nr:SET domain-containing protein 5 [Apophysomyces sp. BC1015]KAG0181774.1 SET domain-containing protein 5 [Apophysomyces sp. BC1021]KAG0192516.1 SET domain-containing protein 5 [Apophysomyces sp. BC1034]
MTEKTTPSEEELTIAIRQLKLENPEMGIKKVAAKVVEDQPAWAVSEKRVKKIMQANSLVQTTTPVKSGVANDPSIPVSFIDPKLDIQSVSTNIVASMINNVTGKGLLAARDIAKNETIFQEIPFMYFPPWDGYRMAREGNACGLCAKPYMRVSRIASRCSHCDVVYCSKACRTTAWETFHQLECTHLNPAIREFINLCESEQWLAPVAVSRMYAHMILAHQRGDLEEVKGHYDAFATVNQAERQAKETEWIFMEHPTRELWAKARALLSKAYKVPPKKCKIQKPLPDDLAAKLFDDEDTFLNYLGKYNINNQNGGMYLVQSHINHNCTPNVCIEHPHNQSQYKISVRAVRDIKQGEQLFETYVNPRWDKETRFNYLNKSYMFECHCQRCDNDEPLTDELRRGLRLRDE